VQKERLLNVSDKPYMVPRLGFPEGAKTAAHLDRWEVDFSASNRCNKLWLGSPARPARVSTPPESLARTRAERLEGR